MDKYKPIEGNTFSGYYVWHQITQLNKDISELTQAMHNLEQDSLPYNTLKEKYNVMREERDEWQKTSLKVVVRTERVE